MKRVVFDYATGRDIEIEVPADAQGVAPQGKTLDEIKAEEKQKKEAFEVLQRSGNPNGGWRRPG